MLIQSGADLSATETRVREHANSVSPARLEAEGAEIVGVQRRRQAARIDHGFGHGLDI